MAEVFLRPDHVARSGIITPYPIRKVSPVAVARGTVTSFVDAVRRIGPALSGALGMSPASRKVRAHSEPVMRPQHSLVRQGPRPVMVTPDAPRVGSSHAENVMRKTWRSTPSKYNALKSWREAEYARAFGSNWDMIVARQRQLRMLRRPGWWK